METQLRSVDMAGYSSTYNFLKSISSHQVENSRDFINYLASLLFSDSLAVWNAFSNYFHNVILKDELEKQKEDLKDQERPGPIQAQFLT